jgi:DNA (cytosine-5)-methyltransferase 1
MNTDMTHASLFSGIGGFDLAAEWMGWENKFHCEWNEFGQKILKHYWPGAELFTDITKSDFKKYANTIDVLTGGFPCQPYSAAGKRLGKEDERHLWPEMLRAIREVAPRYVVGENVRGLTNWNGGMVFDEVCADLENLGYQVAPYLIPACAVNAPHRRERIWFVAYRNNATDTDSNGLQGRECATCYDTQRREESNRCAEEHAINGGGTLHTASWQNFPTESPVCSGDDGIPTQLDSITFPKWRVESIKAYGNAVVPQVVHQIFKAIQEHENIRHTT